MNNARDKRKGQENGTISSSVLPKRDYFLKQSLTIVQLFDLYIFVRTMCLLNVAWATENGWDVCLLKQTCLGCITHFENLALLGYFFIKFMRAFSLPASKLGTEAMPVSSILASAYSIRILGKSMVLINS